MRADYLARCIGPLICDAVPIALLGTEIGQPVSNGRVAVVTNGSVVADGSGYDFTDGVLEVDTKLGCYTSSYTTFTISGKGPVPDLYVGHGLSSGRYVVTIYGGRLWAAYDGHTWAFDAPVSVASGTDYSLVVVVADTYVRVWLNGSSVGRQTIHPNYIQTPPQWQLRVGECFGGTTYTGRVNSITWEVGALYPDVDNI